MAIHGFLETTPPDAGQDDAGRAGVERAARRTLHLEARGATAAGEATDVVIQNISLDGLLLESPLALEPGETILIDLPEAGTIEASVVWTSGDLFGCRFAQSLSPAALAGVELRSDALAPGFGPSGSGTPARSEASADDLAARLQRLRKERGLTLAQVAGQLGVSKPTVWAWERGRARPIEERIDALAEALGVTRSELMATGETSAVLRDLLARSREQIAAAFGTRPENVRIMVEL